jgi:hypothetical protein
MATGPRRGDSGAMTRFRRTLVWLVVGLLVFVLVATLAIDAAG